MLSRLKVWYELPSIVTSKTVPSIPWDGCVGLGVVDIGVMGGLAVGCTTIYNCQILLLTQATFTLGRNIFTKQLFTFVNFYPLNNKKLSYCWDSARYDKISNSGRSANPNRNSKYDLCKFIPLFCTLICAVSADMLKCFKSRLCK